MRTVGMGPAEIENGEMYPENIEVAVEALRKEGLVVLPRVINTEQMTDCVRTLSSISRLLMSMQPTGRRRRGLKRTRTRGFTPVIDTQQKR